MAALLSSSVSSIFSQTVRVYPCQPLFGWDIMSNPTSPSPSVAFPHVASKKWSCSELQAGNQRLMESKVEDSSGDVKAVASYADQLRSRVEAGTLIWFPFVVGIPFESMICFSKKKKVFNHTDPFMERCCSGSSLLPNLLRHPLRHPHVQLARLYLILSISIVPCTCWCTDWLLHCLWLNWWMRSLAISSKMVDLKYTPVTKDSQTNSGTTTKPPD